MLKFDPFRDLPEGFAMALAQDPAAMDAFGQLSSGEKARYVELAHQVKTRAEMHDLVDRLGHADGF